MTSKSIKIVVTGPESTGKTTLAKQLAQMMDALLVPEIAREYLKNRECYSLKDVIEIARMQQEAESMAASQNNTIICDTDASVFWVWCKEKFGSVPESIQEYFRQSEADLYLLCAPDIPWEADPLRENPHNRDYLFKEYRELMINRHFVIIEGKGGCRFNTAIKTIAEIKNGPRGPVK